MLLLLLLVVGARGYQPCHDALSLPLPNASLRPDNGLDHDGLVYPQGTYWKAGDSYFGCPCEVTRCIRRCQAASKEEISNNEDGLMIFVLHENQTNSSVNAYDHFKVVEGEIACTMYDLEPEFDTYAILIDGSLQLLNEAEEYQVYNAETFCVNKSDNEVKVYVCHHEIPEKPVKHYIYPWFMIISAFFLLATIVAYLLAPEIRNLHGRCVVCHSACMMLSFVGLAVIQIEGPIIDPYICRMISMPTYYFLLATFSWMNVMCFDVWRTFRLLTESTQQDGSKKFLLYCTYAFGMPLILFIVTICVELLAPSDSELKPGFEKHGDCWFQNFATESLYYFGPICTILVFNLYFFIATTSKIMRLKRETAVLKEGNSRKHSNTESDKLRFKLYLKLFLVMGLSWIFEVLSFAIRGPEEAWYLTDIYNTLQGVFIFIFCVWFTKVRDSFVRKLFPRFAHKLSTQPGKSVTKTSEVSEGSSVGMSMKVISENVARRDDESF